MKLAFVFPGQGSQAVGMMDGFAAHPVVRETFAEASDALGEDLWALVAEGPAEKLNLTTNTQPVMLTAGVAVWRAWLASGGPQPAVVAGHSLGEYTALVAAGALAFRDAVPLVRFRAQAMQDAVPAGEGAMAAIMGADDGAVTSACAEAEQGQVVEAVNFNAPGQLVIAGHREAVERAIGLAKQKGAKRGVMLPVSAPFHCSLMRPAADRLATRLAEIVIATPVLPVIHNVDVGRAPRPRRDSRRARAAGRQSRALDRHRAGDGGPRRHAHRRVRPGQGTLGTDEADHRRHSRVRADRQRRDRRHAGRTSTILGSGESSR